MNMSGKLFQTVNRFLYLRVLCFLIANCLFFATGHSQQSDENILKDWDEYYRRFYFQNLVVGSAKDAAGGLIGLDTNQIAEVKRLWGEFQEKRNLVGRSFGEKVAEFINAGNHQAASELMELQKSETDAIALEMTRKMEEVLLPHQLTIARQSTLRTYLAEQSGGIASIPLALASLLELSSDERTALGQATARIRMNHERELARARERWARNVERALDPSHSDKLHEIAGADWYERVFVN
jgi:hypothetical protein